VYPKNRALYIRQRFAFSVHYAGVNNPGLTKDSPIGPFDPLPIKAKGGPKGALGLEKSTHNTRREPCLFERVKEIEEAEARNALILQPPPSTAPAVMHTNNPQDDDLYEPGTKNPRAYMRAFITTEDMESDTEGSINSVESSIIASTPEKAGDTIIVVTEIASKDDTNASGISNHSTQELFAFYYEQQAAEAEMLQLHRQLLD
jgi:hypothetical protein